MSAKQCIDKLADLTTEMQVELQKLRLPEYCTDALKEVAIDNCQADVTAMQEGTLHKLRKAFENNG